MQWFALCILIESVTKITLTISLDNVGDYAKGDTALHLAAANGHDSCVNALLFDFKESPNLWARNGYVISFKKGQLYRSWCINWQSS